MPGPLPPAVALSAEERQALDALERRHTVPQQVAVRARIIQLAVEGLNNCQIARHLGLDVDTVRLWRGRWLGFQGVALADLSVEDRLTDAPRPGRPVQITAEPICQIHQLACEAPSQSGRPIRPVEQSGDRRRDRPPGHPAGHLAPPRRPPRQKGDLTPHRVRYWLTPPTDDARFDATVREICSIYRDGAGVGRPRRTDTEHRRTDRRPGARTQASGLATGPRSRRAARVRVYSARHARLHPQPRRRQRAGRRAIVRPDPHRGRLPGPYPTDGGDRPDRHPLALHRRQPQHPLLGEPGALGRGALGPGRGGPGREGAARHPEEYGQPGGLLERPAATPSSSITPPSTVRGSTRSRSG